MHIFLLIWNSINAKIYAFGLSTWLALNFIWQLAKICFYPCDMDNNVGGKLIFFLMLKRKQSLHMFKFLFCQIIILDRTVLQKKKNKSIVYSNFDFDFTKMSLILPWLVL